MLNPNIWRSQQKEFVWQEHRIGYQDVGEGPVLVLLHGLPGSSWDWHPVWPMLSGQFRLIAPDLPGCGDSDKPLLHDYRLADQAAAVLALLEYLDIRDYQLAAHDYGAAIGTLLVQSDQPPQAVSLLSPRLTGDNRDYLWRELWLSGPSGQLLWRLVTEGLYGRYLEKLTGPYARLSTQRLRDSWQLLTAHQGLQVLPQLLNYRYELPLRAEFATATFALPLQLLEGRYDPLPSLSQLLPEAQVSRLDTGHFPQLEDPEHVATLLLDFHCRPDHQSSAVFENLRKAGPSA
ncbi:alpha/beta fold hydrolase [Thalassolituus sp. LLYu03]|uniref:alpha/beta fold hydrolase n=1 Tax=Thalassolituus sp. LLYu03 TaxID=3421656 RepID=UPI003D2A624C